MFALWSCDCITEQYDGAMIFAQVIGLHQLDTQKYVCVCFQDLGVYARGGPFNPACYEDKNVSYKIVG